MGVGMPGTSLQGRFLENDKNFQKTHHKHTKQTEKQKITEDIERKDSEWQNFAFFQAKVFGNGQVSYQDLNPWKIKLRFWSPVCKM